MGTDIRPETSKKNEYWLSKHRYYELLHWCRQYDEWWDKKQECVTAIVTGSVITSLNEADNQYRDSIVEKAFEQLEKFNKKIETLQDTAKKADSTISDYIIFAVTQGKGFTYLSTVKEIPCSKNYFYERYRKFFWLLDKELE